MGFSLLLWPRCRDRFLAFPVGDFLLRHLWGLSSILMAPMKRVAGTNAAAATQQSTTIPKAHMSGIGVLHSGMGESPHDARVAAVNTVASATGSQVLFRGAFILGLPDRCAMLAVSRFERLGLTCTRIVLLCGASFALWGTLFVGRVWVVLGLSGVGLWGHWR